MQRRLLVFSLILGTSWSGLTIASAAEPLWKKFVPRKSVAADPQGDYALQNEHGPWLIMATYFSGENGEQRARDLVLDLRKNHGLKAYHWGMSFQLDNGGAGKGLDEYGGKIRRKYRRGDQVTQFAVLIGDFPSLGDPEAQSLLERVKTLDPASFHAEGEELSAESLTSVNRFRSYLLRSNGKTAQAGPMGHAFVTRNPLLPREYFVPNGVEPEVAKWNNGVEHSLLDCPGKFTIKVATFKGRTSLKAAQDELPDTRTRKAEVDDPLVVAVKNAHLLTTALREKGWEAYEFHDRYESYVTIGSFDEGQQTADGKVVLQQRNAQIVIETFGATSPNNIFNRPAMQDVKLEMQHKQQFKSMLGTQGQIAEGFHPKRFVGLPFDIYPEPIRVPKQSISSAYARN